ncbi:STAS domain-containing protein [Ideonella sp. TBM-1]|uniref:Anti-sigma factor antagonist n=1 Tax=Ideonella livida TaxID=2707176 RepID=A0A7C9TN29_9BURK|nr:STAS domain-containing protein [Ideonella livida]NDY93085.1 STAS domain-containing protein [Ideonella livida]
MSARTVAGGGTAEVLVLSLRGESLDASNVAAFKESALALSRGHPRVVLDMTGLQFVDSSGLGALISCLRQQNGQRGDLRLCHMSPAVRALFELMRMDRVFRIFDRCDDAVASFA